MYQPEEKEYEPYDFQNDCLAAIDAARPTGRALIVLATGLGKTVVMGFEALRFRARPRTLRSRLKQRVLFLCHTNDILYQTRLVFEAINGSDCSYGYFNGDEKNFHDVDFLFASLQTMQNHKHMFRPDEFGEVMVDESHHSHAETYRSTIEYFTPELLLGATATPDRLDELDIRDLFGQEVYNLPLEEAMARGLLTPVDYRLLTDEIQLTQVLEADDGRKLSLSELNKRIFIPRRDEEIAKIIARNAAEIENPRIIIFCSSIEHANHMAQHVENSFAIHTGIPGKERDVRMQMFKLGLIGTVLVVDAFNEGVDVPQANVLVFLRSTESDTVFFQQLGRGLRRSDGKDKVLVLDFVANCERIEMVHKLWKSVVERTGQDAYSGGSRSSADPMTLNVNAVEFMETIVPILRIFDRLRADFYPTWQEASEAARGLGIKTYRAYLERYHEDPRLPAAISRFYADYPGTKEFLKSEFYLTWEEASKAAQKLGILSKRDYDKKRVEDERLPSAPWSYYPDYPGIKTFLKANEFSKRGFYPDWKQAAAAARKLGIKNRKEYWERRNEDPRLPSHPHTYPHFPGMSKFLGKKRKRRARAK